MDRARMEWLVDSELEHIPAGFRGSFQRMLRLEYNKTRLRHLSKSPNTSRDRALAEAIENIRDRYPGATFAYDRTFFATWALIVAASPSSLPCRAFGDISLLPKTKHRMVNTLSLN